MQEAFASHVLSVTRLTETIVELVIHAPQAVKHYQPGQFYRLQTLAITPAACDRKHGTLTFVIHEDTVASKQIARAQPNEPIALMGPTGVRAKIPHLHETLLFISDQRGFSFVRSVGKAAKEMGNHVILVSLAPPADVYCQTELAASTDHIIWAGDDIISTLLAHMPLLGDADRIYLHGSTDLLRRFQHARENELKPHLLKNPSVIGAVYGPMQCMLKGVCAQCLQWQIDPVTGERTKAVFACSWQDQPLEMIDIHHIDERYQINELSEKLHSARNKI